MSEKPEQTGAPYSDHANGERRESKPHTYDHAVRSSSPGHGEPYWPQRKRKWVAGLLSLIVPGIGHFYLGFMQKGLVVMLLIIMDICAIVHFSLNMASIPLITLLSLFLPLIYFYTLFDALQSTDKVNAAYAAKETSFGQRSEAVFGEGSASGGSMYVGWLLVGAGALSFVFGAKPEWIGKMMDKFGTTLGGFVLIGIGILIFLRNMSRPK